VHMVGGGGSRSLRSLGSVDQDKTRRSFLENLRGPNCEKARVGRLIGERGEEQFRRNRGFKNRSAAVSSTRRKVSRIRRGLRGRGNQEECCLATGSNGSPRRRSHTSWPPDGNLPFKSKRGSMSGQWEDIRTPGMRHVETRTVSTALHHLGCIARTVADCKRTRIRMASVQ